ncbi:ETX/MTX2 family pore-forming toxin [Flavobacterium aquicola]|uniref:Toxin ETX/toxin MTX2 n=1 Tax=Flavobacterium aquicola TaxID=1682742 RepID=A0A3E0EDZ0_9FLAO|nr:ETX/MTX2 family pore-forming toxin [Flavobacterium aquicola]REG96498.1 toxin ETX/toxin MTX2 [Flavobacterium aquicola]
MNLKRIIYLLPILLASCGESSIIDETIIPTKKEASLSSLKSTSISNTFDWTGIPVTLTPIKGLTGSKKYLSTTEDGTKVDLWNIDDLSGRQQWVFNPLSDGSYNINIYSGVSNSNRFLSTSEDGRKVDLWTKDDLSGRQRWNIIPLNNDVFSIIVKGGVNTARKYLSCTSDGSLVDLWTNDDLTGRQNWKIEAAGEFDLVGITYSLAPEDVVTMVPSFITSISITNNTALQQTMSANFATKATESSNFSQTKGISIKVSSSLKVKVPFIDGNINTEVTTSASWQYGGASQNEDSRSYNFPISVTPYSTYSITASIAMKKISVNYEATFKHRSTNTIKKLSGRWEGIQASQIVYNINDIKAGKSVTISNLKNGTFVKL